MNKCKKIIIIMWLTIICFTMSACFSYRDINKVLFVTALIVDVDERGNPILYAEVFKGVRSTSPEGMDERILFNGTGKTMFEAVRNMNATSSFKLNYTQNQVTIFTRKAAEFGLENYIDLIDRDQELLLRPYIAVFKGAPQELMTLEIIQEKYIGLYITELIENIGASPRAVVTTQNDYLNERVTGDKTSVLTIVDIAKDTLQTKLEINGGAVIENDKMVSTLQTNEGLAYNFLRDTLSSGTLEVTNPCDINKFVTLEIMKSKTKTEISYSDGVVNLTKKIKVKVNFSEAQKSITLSEENVAKIQEKAEENIVKACNMLFAKYKKLDIDIFQIRDKFYGKYPKVKVEDIINETELKVEVEVQIDNTGTTNNFE